MTPSNPRPVSSDERRAAVPSRYLVVMGVAGTGKSEIGHRLAEILGGAFVEADQFHSKENVERMRNGIGLTDADRWPWLAAVCDAATAETGQPVVIACSVLKRSYRDFLRQRLGNVQFLFLHGAKDLINSRLLARRDHFASASLLESQFQALEPPAADEKPIWLDIAKEPAAIVAEAVDALGVWLVTPSEAIRP